jgi:hypothetical protein
MVLPPLLLGLLDTLPVLWRFDPPVQFLLPQEQVLPLVRKDIEVELVELQETMEVRMLKAMTDLVLQT